MFKIGIFDNAKTDWTSEDYYNFEDLNRVEAMTEEVVRKVEAFRAKTIDLFINTIRTMNSIEFAEEFNRIENNISILGNELNTPTGYITPKTNWYYNNPFSYVDANRLEQNLVVLNDYVSSRLSYFRFAGMYTVGDEGVF